MLKVVAAAWLVFAAIHYSQTVPDRTDMAPGSVPQRFLKRDRFPVCNKGAAWPYHDVSCLRERTQPVEQPPAESRDSHRRDRSPARQARRYLRRKLAHAQRDPVRPNPPARFARGWLSPGASRTSFIARCRASKPRYGLATRKDVASAPMCNGAVRRAALTNQHRSESSQVA